MLLSFFFSGFAIVVGFASFLAERRFRLPTFEDDLTLEVDRDIFAILKRYSESYKK